MESRRRNTAYLLIFAGLFVLCYNLLGFYTLSAIVVILLGIYKLRAYADNRTGYLLVGVGLIILVGGHLTFVLALILLSLGYFMLKSGRVQQTDQYTQRQGILESIKLDREPWVLKNMSQWFIIGEAHVDFSLAIIDEGETTMMISGMIGDADILLPEDLGIAVEAFVTFGQAKLGPEKDSGVFNRISWQSPNYLHSPNKVKLLISYIVGDIDIKIV
ncbi:MAG TPA: cell wall-active antibiotics response protein LiaF [Bacilli bacterium]